MMAVGGMVAGLIAARRKGLYKKMTTLMIGLGGKICINLCFFPYYNIFLNIILLIFINIGAGTGVLCYPDQSKILAGEAGKLALKNARIAYHFIVGGINMRLNFQLSLLLLNLVASLILFMQPVPQSKMKPANRSKE
jgi:hypothetical protein